MIQPYCSRQSKASTLAKLEAAGWGELVSPVQTYRKPPPLRYVIDNGAWSQFLRRQEWLEGGRQGPPPLEFDRGGFVRMVEEWGAGADWIAVPDVVAGGLRSLAVSLDWLPWVRSFGLSLIPVQDGIDPHHVEHLMGPDVGIFLGGSTEWKIDTMEAWGQLAARTGCHYHVARVNTGDRIRRAQVCGADSFDGTSVTLFSKTLVPLDGCRRQQVIPGVAPS